MNNFRIYKLKIVEVEVELASVLQKVSVAVWVEVRSPLVALFDGQE